MRSMQTGGVRAGVVVMSLVVVAVVYSAAGGLAGEPPLQYPDAPVMVSKDVQSFGAMAEPREQLLARYPDAAKRLRDPLLEPADAGHGRPGTQLVTGQSTGLTAQEDLPPLEARLSGKLDAALSRLARIQSAGRGVTAGDARCLATAPDGGLVAHVFVRCSASKRDDARAAVRSFGGHVGTALSDVMTATIPAARIADVASDQAVVRLESADKFTYCLDLSVPEMQLDLVHTGSGGSPGAYEGTDVVVGTVDSGIDWTHQDFRNDDGSTRIVAMWDQTDGGGPAPTAFGYGAEWTEIQINNELDGTPAGIVRETDTIGHGTHVAGIAASNGRAPGAYVGAAPDADLVVVKTHGYSSTIVDGVNYIFQLAASQGKPAVVNISMGSNWGPHDNTSSYETSLNQLTGSGKIVCMSAGNSGDNYVPSGYVPVAQHCQATATASEKMFVFRGYDSGAIFDSNVWYDEGSIQFKVMVNVLWEGQLYYCGESAWVSPGGTWSGWIQDEGYNAVYIDINASNTSDPGNGAKEVIISGTRGPLYPGSAWSDYFHIIYFKGSGTFDAWNSNPNDGFYSNQITGTETSDNAMTVSGGATAANVLAVGAYVTRLGGSSLTVGDICDFSSIGPSRKPGSTGQKPEIAAPGEIIMSARSSDSSGSGDHVAMQGTSMSCPHVTGTVALMLQRCSTLTPMQCRAHLGNGARADAYTGTLPNDIWGYGKSDALNTLIDVPSAPTIVTHPQDEQVCENQSVTLSVTTTGAAPLSYQWRKNGEDLPGETSSSLTIDPVSAADAGSYDVVVTNDCGQLTSDPATLTVFANPTPTITADPSETVCEGTTITLDAGAGYSGYYWSPGGQTTRTIQVTASGTYDVTVTDANGCEGWDDIVITVNANPTATASNDGPVSDGDDVQLIGGPDGMLDYSWTGPNSYESHQQDPVVSPAVAGEYCLTVTDGNGCTSTPACTTVEIAPLVTLVASEPSADGSLPKLRNNLILCTFDGPITLPDSGNPLVVTDITNGCVDVSASFAYTIDADDPNGTTLEARENTDPNDPNSGALTNLTWYQVESAPGWACVAPFQFEVYTLVGDCMPSARVTTADYSCVKAALGQRGDVRADLNGSGRVTTADYSVVKATLGYRGPAKPALCP